MRFDLMAGAATWTDTARLARDVERAGFSGMLFTEATQTPSTVSVRSVADTSVMPTIPSAKPNLPTMVAERISSWLAAK